MIYSSFNLFLTLQLIIGYFFLLFLFFTNFIKNKFKNFYRIRLLLIFFTCLKMPVDITQCRGSVGIFNNRNFVFRPKFSNFIGDKCWNSNHLYFSHLYFNISMVFPMNLVLFLVFVIVFS